MVPPELSPSLPGRGAPAPAGALPSRVSPWGLLGILAAAALVPWLAPNAYIVQVGAFAGLYVIMATGLNLLMGYAGQVSLGHAGFYGLGAYISGILGARLGVSPWLGMLAALAVTCLLAGIIGIPALKLRSHYLAMATLGVGILLDIAFIQLHWWTGGSSGLANIPHLSIGPWELATDAQYFWLIWLFAGVALGIALNLANSRVGRILRALGDSPVAAQAMGVDTAAYKLRVFVLSAAYASLAGSLYAHYITVISPEIFSFLFSVLLVLMVAIGGIGQFWGGVLGAVPLTVLPEYLRRYGEYEVPIYGLILILVMMFFPRGLGGLLGRMASIWGRRLGGPAPGPRAAPSGATTGAALSAIRDAPSAMAAGGPPLLEVVDLVKHFGGVVAVSGCAFAVGRREVVGVIGPNGAGKTTIFNIVTGLYTPTGGEIRFGGRPIHGLPPFRIAAEGLSRTFQNLQIFRSLSAVENVMVGRHMAARAGFLESALPLPRPRREERQALERALACLDLVGLGGAAWAPAASLPFGQQKILEIARAVATEPILLLLDEPAAGLNASEGAEMARLIARLREQGMSVVLIEHDMHLVMEVCDRVVVLNYGEKIAEGTPAEVQADERVVKVYLGEEVALA